MEFKEVRELLEALCSADGTSGQENCAADTAEKLLAEFMPVSRDALGSVMGRKGEGKGIILDAHIDQIGLVVTGINENGFIKVAKVGGADIRVLTAAQVTIHGKKDIFGVITSVPPHLADEKDEGKALPFDKITIDAGMSKAELAEIVTPGDRITFNGPFDSLMGSRIVSPCVDDRAGVAAILRCLQLLKDKNTCPIEVMFSCQEETGGSGAAAGSFSTLSDEAIATDVSFASAPGVSKEKYRSLGDGALIGFAPSLDYEMSRKLTAIAKERGIKAAPEIMGGSTGTNCDDIQIARGGIKTALISIPIRNMHTAVEVADLSDIEETAKLMAAYIEERSKEYA
ncbi:MAG: M20/M25/M40 family metallo-hydrolase [Clostridia bacterium]|nr:M20/M25/M40 family metallo-hydrolase [Clostridia bacterium]